MSPPHMTTHTHTHTHKIIAGSAPLATDVIDFVSVGVAVDTVATGLSLQSGHTYYVTIRATDFTGQSNYSVSHPVTIDTSVPVIGNIWISNTTDYSDGLELEWDPVEDLQSDVIGMEWSLGSRPGSSDISGWNSVNVSEAAGGVSVRGIQFYDGQLIFASIKVSTCIWNFSVKMLDFAFVRISWIIAYHNSHKIHAIIITIRHT